MREKIAEIIEALEKADELFKELPDISKEAAAFWKAGIDQFAAALWVCEHNKEKAKSKATEELTEAGGS